MKEALLVLFGFSLGLIPTWFDRKRKLRTHSAAIRAELELCRERAISLLNDSVRSPLYRLPLAAYQISFPTLLAEGALSEQELLSVGRFYGQSQDINRGLDNAAQMLQSNDTAGLDREYQRNLLKARRLVESDEASESLYAIAKRVVDSKVERPWWRY
jgi:hypothetical protein